MSRTEIELQETVDSISNDIEFIESTPSLPNEWLVNRWHRFTNVAEEATDISRKTLAIAKLAYYAIYRGRLWRAAFANCEEWIANVSVEHMVGMSRSSLYEMFADVEMARKAGLALKDVAGLLAAAPSALRDARRLWLNADGTVRSGLNLPDGGVAAALKVASSLSPSEARTYVGLDVAGKISRYVKDWNYAGDRLLITLIVEGDVVTEHHLTVYGILDQSDIDWLVRQLGWRYRKDEPDEPQEDYRRADTD